MVFVLVPVDVKCCQGALVLWLWDPMWPSQKLTKWLGVHAQTKTSFCENAPVGGHAWFTSSETAPLNLKHGESLPPIMSKGTYLSSTADSSILLIAEVSDGHKQLAFAGKKGLNGRSLPAIFA